MLLHLVRSRPGVLFWRTYRLTARLEVSRQEYQAVRSHGLHRFEVFADPFREHLLARAEAAYERVKAVPLFSTEPEKNALASIWQTSRQITLLVRARRCFRITIGDLVDGITISNRSLNAIANIEYVLHESVDAIAGTVAAALDYQHGEETLLTPGTREDETTPPEKWPTSW